MGALNIVAKSTQRVDFASIKPCINSKNWCQHKRNGYETRCDSITLYLTHAHSAIAMILSSIGFIIKATQFAAHKHRHQRRKGKQAVPYINHPVDLVYLLSNRAGIQDDIVLAAALLHDTVEDTDTTLDEIEREFGKTARDVVAEVTDDKMLSAEERKQHQIDHAPHLSDRARLVKLADKIANLHDILSSPPDGWSTQRKLDYFHWAKQVIDPIRGSNTILEQIFDDVYERGIHILSKS